MRVFGLILAAIGGGFSLVLLMFTLVGASFGPLPFLVWGAVFIVGIIIILTRKKSSKNDNASVVQQKILQTKSDRPSKEEMAREFRDEIMPRSGFEALHAARSTGRQLKPDDLANIAMEVLQKKYGLTSQETIEIVAVAFKDEKIQ